MTPDAVLEEFRAAGALLEGHFILSSGLRSSRYLQCALVLKDPRRAERLCRALVAQLPQGLRIDSVVSPAMGGVIVGYEMARALGCQSMFLERPDGVFHLRRGFSLQPGERVFMMEDIVTTGLSSRECLASIAGEPGTLVGAACLVDRSGGKAQLGVPLVSLISLDIPAYAPDALPPELAALPATKPGSRGLAV